MNTKQFVSSRSIQDVNTAKFKVVYLNSNIGGL